MIKLKLKDCFRFPVANQSKDLEILGNKERGFLQNAHIGEEVRGQYLIHYDPRRKENHF